MTVTVTVTCSVGHQALGMSSTKSKTSGSWMCALNIVIWDGALWFWSVIKTIMTDCTEYSLPIERGKLNFNPILAWFWQKKRNWFVKGCWTACCKKKGIHLDCYSRNHFQSNIEFFGFLVTFLHSSTSKRTVRSESLFSQSVYYTSKPECAIPDDNCFFSISANCAKTSKGVFLASCFLLKADQCDMCKKYDLVTLNFY